MPHLLRGGEGDVCVFGRKQVAEGGIGFVVRAVVSVAFVEPVFEMFARGGGELREKQSGTALIAGPDDIGMALQSDVCAGKHAAKNEIRTDGHGLGSLNGETVLTDIDADSGDRSGREVEIDQGL